MQPNRILPSAQTSSSSFSSTMIELNIPVLHSCSTLCWWKWESGIFSPELLFPALFTGKGWHVATVVGGKIRPSPTLCICNPRPDYFWYAIKRNRKIEKYYIFCFASSCFFNTDIPKTVFSHVLIYCPVFKYYHFIWITILNAHYNVYNLCSFDIVCCQKKPKTFPIVLQKVS